MWAIRSLRDIFMKEGKQIVRQEIVGRPTSVNT